MKKFLSVSSLGRRDRITGYIMILFSLVYFSPVFIMLYNSVKPLREVLLDTFKFPSELVFDHYATILFESNYIVLFSNSFVITFCSVLGVVITSSMAGYYIARSKGKMASNINLYLVLAYIVPFQAIMIPLVKLMSSCGLSDSIPGMILCYIGSCTPMSVFLYTGAVCNVPIELEESAKIDGAGWFRTYWKIVFPLLKPITSTVVVLNSFWIWNDFLLPLILLTSDTNKTVPVGIMNLVNGQFGANIGASLSACILSALPIIIVYILLQKYFVKGIAAGAVKG